MKFLSLFRMKQLLCTAAITMNTTMASASGVYQYSGDTSTGITEHGYGEHVLNFSVSVSGRYDFGSLASGFDNFLALYSYPYNPADVDANRILIVDANDRDSGFESFGHDLATGINYSLVNSSAYPGENGPFTTSIVGPGIITPLEVAAAVPEPETYALLLSGLATLGAIARRRKIG